MTRALIAIIVCGCVAAGTVAWGVTRERVDPMDGIAARYIELSDALMQQDELSASGDDGVVSKSAEKEGEPVPLTRIATEARRAREALDALATPDPGARRSWLRAQLAAVATRARQQAGETLALDDEFSSLYGIGTPGSSWRGPRVDPATLDVVRDHIDALLPGTATPAERLEAFESSVTVPAPRLASVFEAALAECRSRSRKVVTLPAREHVTVRYVVGEPWSGFSAYQGDDTSVISVNTSFPLTVDRVLQLACHEGYPGHHVINVLRDRARRTRPELAAVPLFSPEAFATERLATQAVSLVFSDEERARFEREVLFPLAGLPAAEAARHVQVAQLLDQLRPAVASALEPFLRHERGFVETAWQLQREALMQHPRATLEFASAFRGIALAYTGVVRAAGSPGGQWLEQSGYPSEPVIMTGNGHHSSASSFR